MDCDITWIHQFMLGINLVLVTLNLILVVNSTKTACRRSVCQFTEPAGVAYEDGDESGDESGDDLDNNSSSDESPDVNVENETLAEDTSPDETLAEDTSPDDVSPEDMSPDDVSPDDVSPEDNVDSDYICVKDKDL